MRFSRKVLGAIKSATVRHHGLRWQVTQGLLKTDLVSVLAANAWELNAKTIPVKAKASTEWFTSNLRVGGGNDEAGSIFRSVIFIAGLILHFDPAWVCTKFFPISKVRGEIATAGDVAQVG